MAFIGEGIGNFATWFGEDVIGGLTGSKQAQEASEQAALESKREAEKSRGTAAEQSQLMQQQLGRAEAGQAQAMQGAMGQLQPFAQMGLGAQQNYMSQLAGGPMQFDQGTDANRQQVMDLIGQGGQPINPQFDEMIRSSMSFGPLEETSGFQNMQQARSEALTDLGSGLGASGLMFSGARMQGAADISGSMRQQLEEQQYKRNQQGIAGLMGLDQAGYGRQQAQMAQLMGIDESDAARRMQQQQQQYGAQQDYLTRLSGAGQMGQDMAGQMAQMQLGQGNLMGQQGLATQQGIGNLMMQGQGMASGLMGQAGQQQIAGAQMRQDAIGDIIGAGATIFGASIGAA